MSHTSDLPSDQSDYRCAYYRFALSGTGLQGVYRFQSILVVAVCTFQWMFWGYSLAFSRTSGPFIGDLANFGLKNVLAAPSIGGPIPEIVFCLYELMFCACTVMIVVGGSFERGRIIPSLVFGFFWATIVYCPIACWTWNPSGWLFTLPSLDFAGGGPVHIASGSAGLAYALILGKRKGLGETIHQKPHNTTLIFLGMVLIWFGWFGFNGGSAINASIRAMVAAFNTQVAASTGAIGWVMVDYVKHKRKFSVVGACEGVVSTSIFLKKKDVNTNLDLRSLDLSASRLALAMCRLGVLLLLAS